MRRCLGILSEITLVSGFAASLVTGALEPSEIVVKKHKFMEVKIFTVQSVLTYVLSTLSLLIFVSVTRICLSQTKCS